MLTTRQEKRRKADIRESAEIKGLDFVRCSICGDHRRVISGRHLSKHGTDRESYMQEYRLSPDELCAKDFRRIQSSRRGYIAHGKRDWIAAIKKVHKQHGQVFAGHLQDNYPHLYNQGVWLFGDWDKALRAAAFDPPSMRQWEFRDRVKILTQIRSMRQSSLPLYAKYVMKHHPKLFSAAGRECGSWRKALMAAGMEIPKYAHGGLLFLLRALREALDRHSTKHLPQPLKSCAVYYFGSLRKAIAAAKRERVVSPKAGIATALYRMHMAKQTLIYTEVRRDHLPLVRAAEKHFGSWGKALYAAGIDSNLYYVHHKWSGAKVSQTSKRLWPAT